MDLLFVRCVSNMKKRQVNQEAAASKQWHAENTKILFESRHATLAPANGARLAAADGIYNI